MFRQEDDFKVFQRAIIEAHERQPIRILSYCVLSNHWHVVVWPKEDGQLTDFSNWACSTRFVRKAGPAKRAKLRTAWRTCAR